MYKKQTKMGDYTKSGAKIGTCGAGYYATKQMLEAVNDNDSTVAAYLNPNGKCSFAFPFPEYDGMQIGQMSNFHEGERVDLTFFFPANIESHHKQVLYQFQPKGAPMHNLYCECPQKYRENALEHEHIYFRLTEQVWHDGQLKIAAICPYCETRNIFSKEEAELICTTYFDKFSQNKDTQAYYSEIAKRIRATYCNQLHHSISPDWWCNSNSAMNIKNKLYGSKFRNRCKNTRC